MAAEKPVDIAYVNACESLAGQRGRLDNLRTRSVAVITAASVLASFLGGQALADTKAVPGASSPVADRSLQLWEIVGFGAFVLTLLLSAWVIRPKTKGWTFRMNSRWILEDAKKKEDEAQIRALRERKRCWHRTPAPTVDLVAIADRQKHELVEYMEDYHKSNEPKIERLFVLLQVSVILLAVEALGFMLDLSI